MAVVLVVLGLTAVTFGAVTGVFIVVSLAIRWEDRRKWSLRLDAPSHSTKAARSLVGISGCRWE